jgi:hypothetical protein
VPVASRVLEVVSGCVDVLDQVLVSVVQYTGGVPVTEFGTQTPPVGKPLVALVSAADLERLEELPESADEQVVSSLSSVREVAAAPRERQRFGIAAEHRGHGAS